MAEKDLPATVEMPDLRLPPAVVTDYAKDAAKELLEVVKKAGMVITVNKQKYLRYEGWQTLGVFMGRAYGGPVTAGAEEAEPVENGYKARARAWCDGKVISDAVAYCYRDEKQWANKPAFQLASMAQTRASAKALRNVLAWVLTLAQTGIKPTPAEEMEHEAEPSDLFISFCDKIAEAEMGDTLTLVSQDVTAAHKAKKITDDEHKELVARGKKRRTEIDNKKLDNQ